MTHWTDDQIADLRDYFALGYKLDEILTETDRPLGEVEAKMRELGIWASATSPERGSESREDGPEFRAPAPSSEADVGDEKPNGTAAPLSNLPDALAHGGRTEGDSRPAPASSSVDDRHHPAPRAAHPSDGKRWDDLSQDGRLYQVRTLADGRASFTEIGRMLGTSRNAISGFVDRNRDELGIAKTQPGKNGGGRPKSKAEPKPKAIPAPRKATTTPPRSPSMVTPLPAPKLVKLPPAPIVPPDPSAVIALADAGALRCHFPLWAHHEPAPNMEDGKACGMPVRPGAPYCEHHFRLTHQPPAARRPSEAEAA
ncbi:hypothetical protein C3941_19665 [Kaistia algarum]|uniref:GcrA family cell cycle regulator n=1 Tax=Kaistia algarum TaxID=2083279 RepID=UPI000CE86597|nr:GcrA family cell cycle regulator [Kaistia algarum]MCX5516209.1 hypothetical protein [Kaistia algarum]PPE78284.1 hypothetical protein C3941_19665 [Kaistia algarum]